MKARKAMVKDLEEQGYLVKVEPHSHNVGTHDRCHTTVEPLIKQQWFVKMDELAKPAIEAVKNGDLKFVPERFDKIYLHWLENIRDWCISPADLVGTQDSGVLLRRVRRSSRIKRNAGQMSEVRMHSLYSG